MATIREYFDTDTKVVSIHKEWNISDSKGNIASVVTAKKALDLEGNAKYLLFYVPNNEHINTIVTLINLPMVENCQLGTDVDPISVSSGFRGYSEHNSSDSLIFTKRIFFYVDGCLGEDRRRQLTADALNKGLFVVIRDQEYASARSAAEKPLAFISHDSTDKATLVRELALELTKLNCPVWYDEYSLKVGDSLRSNIEKGLKEAHKCILILSPAFLANEGWGKAEFDSIYTREIHEKKNVILPVWHNVGKDDVYKYSPRLADKVGLDSSIGISQLAAKLRSAVIG